MYVLCIQQRANPSLTKLDSGVASKRNGPYLHVPNKRIASLRAALTRVSAQCTLQMFAETEINDALLLDGEVLAPVPGISEH